MATGTREDKHLEIVVPVHEEELVTRVVKTEGDRVRVTKTVEDDEVVVDAPYANEEILVERVRVDRDVDAVPPVRTEGATTIVPVVEETVVVQRRLVVREEIRITKRRVEQTRPVHVVLRRERAEVEHIRQDPNREGRR